MASKEHELAIKIAGKVDASLGSSIDQVNSRLSQLGKMAKLAGKVGINQIGSGIANTAKLTTAAIGAASAGIIGLGKSAIQVGSEFETSMSQVQATMLIDRATEEGAKQYDMLEQAARECGRTTAFSATEAAQALNYLALANYDAEKSAVALPTILKLAGAGAMELQTTSDMVTDAMSKLNIEATQDNLSMFSDQLAKAASKSNTSVQQLGDALLQVGATANTLPGKLTESNTVLGILADNGIKGAEGGTQLRNIIQSLTNPTDKAAEKMESLGLKVADAQGNMRSMEEIMYDLNMALSGEGTADKQRELGTIFNKYDLGAVQALMAATALDISGLSEQLGSMGIKYAEHSGLINQIATDYNALNDKTQATQWIMDEMGVSTEQANAIFETIVQNCGTATNRFQELGAEIRNSKGACDEMYAIQLDNLEGDIAILNSGFDDLKISISKELIPGCREFVQLGSEMMTILSAGYDANGLAGVVSNLGQCISMGISKIAEYVPVVAEMSVNLLSSFVDGIAQNASAIANSVAQVGGTLIQGLFTLMPQIYLAGIEFITQLAQGITSQIPQLIDSGTQAISNFAQGFSTAFPEMLQAGAELISTLMDSISQNADSLISSGVQIIGTLLTGILQALPQVINSGVQLIGSLVQGIVNNLPQIISVATQVIVCFISGIAQALPQIVETSVQIITSLMTGIADNAENIAVAGGQIIMALLTGIVRAAPALVKGVWDIIQLGFETIRNPAWIFNIGKNLIVGLLKGIASMGSMLWDTIKALILGQDPPDLSQYGVEAAQSYQQGLERGMSQGNAQKLFSNTGAWTNSSVPQLEQAGVTAGAAYARGLNQGITASKYPALDILQQQNTPTPMPVPVPDNSQAVQAMAESGQASADAYKQSLEAGMSDVNVATNIDTSATTAAMQQAGTESGTAYTESLDTTISNYTLGVNVDTGQAVQSFNTAGTEAGNAFNQSLTAALSAIDFATILNTTTIPPIFTQAGNEGMQALTTAITASQGLVLGAITALTTAITQAFATCWSSVISTAQSSLAQLTSVCGSEAQRAANVIKQAFEGMIITIPKPRIPQISVSTNTVSYGDGGSVSVPNFSVAWNAKGGIFSKPTIFSTASGLQGVGEAGPEAIIPLDTMWNRLDNIMRDTYNDSHNQVDNTTNNKTDNVKIEYKPTYQFYGGTPSKQDIVEAETMSQAKFNKMLDKYFKDKKRTSFA